MYMEKSALQYAEILFMICKPLTIPQKKVNLRHNGKHRIFLSFQFSSAIIISFVRVFVDTTVNCRTSDYDCGKNSCYNMKL